MSKNYNLPPGCTLSDVERACEPSYEERQEQHDHEAERAYQRYLEQLANAMDKVAGVSQGSKLS